MRCQELRLLSLCTSTSGQLLRPTRGEEFRSRRKGIWGKAGFIPCTLGPAQVGKWVHNLTAFRIQKKKKRKKEGSCISFLVRAFMKEQTRGWLVPVVNVGIQPPPSFPGAPCDLGSNTTIPMWPAFLRFRQISEIPMVSCDAGLALQFRHISKWYWRD